ncbi:MAG: TetR/AcrR family transcriptional regulator C-terminal domain-containing protein [Candidatus Dormibacteraeota bacterium]|nr:TetR/AcrR family transcriptional regulator C-terminal domain-containing protein [Candidatus Dormibacteraeota bacterium]
MPRPRQDDAPPPVIWSEPQPAARRRSLGREEIVRAAIAVADQGGAGALTMATVARHLGSYTAMALYRHVPDKDSLVDLMLDAAIAEVELPSAPAGDWREALRGLALATWEMVKRHWWFAQLVYTRPPAGPHMMARTEFMLAVFARRGVPAPMGIIFASLVDRHIFGNGLQEAEERRMRDRYRLDTTEKLLAAMKPVRDLAQAGGRYPHLAGWLDQSFESTPDEQFELGLDCLLDGIALRLPAGDETGGDE